VTSTVQRLALKLLRVHDVIYQRSGGWVGQRIPFAPPNLLLHSVGAKTGKGRVNTLTYATDGGNYLIVSSNGGTNRYPGWYYNLKATPDVQINVGPKRILVTARIVLPKDPDYQRLWQIVNDNNADRYSAYQERTDRPLAVIVLSPR
jgi:deazaflavin-dependent oxidoreductase (nitroreductase family)